MHGSDCGPFQCFPGINLEEMRKTAETFIQYSRFQGQDSNQARLEDMS